MVFPAGFDVDVAGRRHPGRRPRTATARSSSGRGRLANPLTFFAFLVADRPGAYAERRRPRRSAASRSTLTIRAWTDDLAWAKRVGGARRAGPAGPRRADRPALAARRRARRPGGGQPLDGRLCRPVRPAERPGRGRLLRRRLRGPARGGARLVQRQPAGRPVGERGVRLVLRPRGGRRRSVKVKADGDELTAGARKRRIPLNAWGPVGRADKATEDYAYAAVAGARPGDRRAGRRRTGCARSGRTRPAGSAPTSRRRPTGRRRRRRARRPRPSTARRTGVGCWTCSRHGRRRPTTTCGGRGSPATRTCPSSTPARPPGRGTPRSSRRPATGSCRGRPRRDAGVAVRRRDRAARATPRRSSPSATRSPTRPPRPASTAPATLRDGVREPGRVRRRDVEAAAELEAIDRYQRPPATPARPPPTSYDRSACGGRRPRPTWTAPGRFATGDLAGAAAAARRDRPGRSGRRRAMSAAAGR